jgi:hypothetical protein
VLDARDVWHPAALRLHDALIAAQLPLVYFDCVPAEASSTLARCLREQRRVQEFTPLLDRLMIEFPSEMLTWLTRVATPEDVTAALASTTYSLPEADTSASAEQA